MTEHAEARLDRLAELIARAPLNLVSRGDRSDVRTLHVAESAAVGARLCPLSGRWLDLGTGGGLPGLVLAIQYPRVEWVLLDSTRKKIAAVDRFVEALALENVVTLAGRAEEKAREPRWRGRFDGVIARAVAALDVVTELGRGFLRPGGRLVVVKGPRWRDELRNLERAAALLAIDGIHADEVPDTARPTWLVTMRAHGPVPLAVPRPPGVPRAQPLGGRDP